MPISCNQQVGREILPAIKALGSHLNTALGVLPELLNLADLIGHGRRVHLHKDAFWRTFKEGIQWRQYTSPSSPYTLYSRWCGLFTFSIVQVIPPMLAIGQFVGNVMGKMYRKYICSLSKIAEDSLFHNKNW